MGEETAHTLAILQLFKALVGLIRLTAPDRIIVSVGDRFSLVTDIRTLTPIGIADLQDPGEYNGTLLIGEVITHAITAGPTFCVLQDIDGDAVPLIFNTFNTQVVVDPDPAFPRGTILAIKEPLVKFNAPGFDGLAAVVVESPSDVVELDPVVDAATLSALAHAEWAEEPAGDELERGNAALVLGDARSALKFFNRGNSTAEKKADALIQLGRFTEAFDLLKDTSSLSLLAQAAYGAGEWETAVECCRKLVTINDSAKERTGLRDAERRAKEAKGDFDFVELIRTRGKTATFVNAGLEQRESPGKGIGVFAVDAIAAGTLIVAEPAFATSGWNPRSNVMAFGPDHADVRATTYATFCAAIDAIQRKAIGSAAVQSLWAGKPEPELPEGVIDPWRLARIAEDNSFALQQVFDPVTLEGIQSGLFAYASRFNHACDANTWFIFIGETIFIRTRRDVAAGEEITVGYTHSAMPLGQRTAALAERGFTCNCAMCVEQRADAEYEARERFLAEIAELPEYEALAKVKAALPALREAFANRKFKYQFARILTRAQALAAAVGDGDLAYSLVREMLECRGDMPTNAGVALWRDFARFSFWTGRKQEAKEGLEQAVKDAQILYGFPRALWERAITWGRMPLERQLREMLNEIDVE
jgi:tetratricopeptide (TPR) repeat protein